MGQKRPENMQKLKKMMGQKNMLKIRRKKHKTKGEILKRKKDWGQKIFRRKSFWAKKIDFLSRNWDKNGKNRQKTKKLKYKMEILREKKFDSKENYWKIWAQYMQKKC